jgi:RNA polymerase sigma-B factor
MRSLTRIERAVVRLRFEHDLTQSEIGDRLEISQMQVSRVLRRSITKLRTTADVATDANGDVVEAA